MFAGLRRSVTLLRVSWRVLLLDRELLLLPVLSIAACLGLLAAWAALAFGALRPAFEAASGDMAAAVLAVLVGSVIATVLGAWVVATFFTAALIAAAQERLAGGDPTAWSGMRTAARRLPQIMKWGLIRGAAAFLLGRRRGGSGTGLLGGLVPDLAGLAWSVASYLVTPVILTEGAGPVTGIKRSVELLRGTWGEQLSARFGFGLLRRLPTMVAFGAGWLGWNGAFAAPAWLVFAALGTLVCWLIVIHTLESIFQAALYDYACGVEPRGFEPGLLAGAYEERGPQAV